MGDRGYGRRTCRRCGREVGADEGSTRVGWGPVSSLGGARFMCHACRSDRLRVFVVVVGAVLLMVGIRLVWWVVSGG